MAYQLSREFVETHSSKEIVDALRRLRQLEQEHVLQGRPRNEAKNPRVVVFRGLQAKGESHAKNFTSKRSL